MAPPTKTTQLKSEKRLMEEKISKVREVVKNISTNNIVLALHNFDLDVERTIHAFCEGGSETALGDWESTAKKRTNKNKSKAAKSVTNDGRSAAEMTKSKIQQTIEKPPCQQVDKSPMAQVAKNNDHTNNATTNGVLRRSVKNYVLDAGHDKKTLEELTNYAINYSHSIGNVSLWNERKDCADLSVTPPIALLPSPFPAELFEMAKDVQKTLNELFFRISLDHEFLIDAYKDLVKADKWIAKQVELMEAVRKEGVRQKISVQLQRVDYLSHWDEQEQKMELKQVQVEVTNGQVGGPGFATLMTELHKRLLEKVETLRYGPLPSIKGGKTPDNCPRRGMAETMLHAWKLFGDPKAVVMFVNQPELFPMRHFEQLQFIQFELERLARAEGFQLNVVRMSIKESTQRLRLGEEGDFSLYADGKRVALVHLAYGDLPEHYATEKEWKTRFDMERSTAILSPNIRLSLSATNRIQQILAKPGVIERFLPNQTEKIALLRNTFTGLWSLEADDDQTRAVVKDAIAFPKKFVMKAQTGIDKDNFFGEQMVEMLRKMSVKERGAYILRQKIWPIVAKNYLKRPFDAPILENIVSEVGIYGSLIGDEGDGGKVLWNRVEGYLARSKAHHVNQGSVSEGGGGDSILDSLLLFPQNEFH